MKLDKKRVYEKLDEINDSLEQVGRLKTLSLDEFLSSRDYKDIAYANMIIISESIIDICYHVTARKLKKAPKSYADCFILMKESGLIKEKTAEILVRMAKFRNLIIHRYERIDFAKIYDFIKNLPVWINTFTGEVMMLLEEN